MPPDIGKIFVAMHEMEWFKDWTGPTPKKVETRLLGLGFGGFRSLGV